MLQQKQISLTPYVCEKHADFFWDDAILPCAAVFYFHGGGLLYGTRTDLPKERIQSLALSGFLLVTCDYPLAPQAKISVIFEDVCRTVTELAAILNQNTGAPFPFFLWGRSAGAYLCLLAAAWGPIPSPVGVISYYGYGLLTDGWFEEPSPHYQALPPVNEAVMETLPPGIHTEGPLETHYGAYVRARQTGQWPNLISDLPKKQFYVRFTLRALERFPVPLFCAHSLHDPDVPYEEFLALTGRFPGKTFTSGGKIHDFDREDSPVSRDLSASAISFLKQCLAGRNP